VFLERINKPNVVVGYYGLQGSIEVVDLASEQAGDLFYAICYIAEDVVSYLCKSIDNYEDSVESV
jgi:hypothetical protein